MHIFAQATPIELSGSQATVIISGAVLIIGAISAGIVAVIKALGENRRKTETIVQQNERQLSQLNRVESKVNGRYGEVLRELADVRRLIANQTGLAADKAKADSAEAKADEQK